jgi:ANTAR domain
MPEKVPGTGPAKQAGWLDSLRSRSERAWQDAQAAWERAQAIQARQAQAAGGSARDPRTVSLSVRLEARLASMPVIEQAKGVLMAPEGCDAGQAFDLLCRAAQRSSLPVRELAEQVVKEAQQGGSS